MRTHMEATESARNSSRWTDRKVEAPGGKSSARSEKACAYNNKAKYNARLRKHDNNLFEIIRHDGCEEYCSNLSSFKDHHIAMEE